MINVAETKGENIVFCIILSDLTKIHALLLFI